MAYVYTAGGYVIHAQGESREALTERIRAAGAQEVLELLAIGFTRDEEPFEEYVSVPVAQIAAVCARQLPPPD